MEEYISEIRNYLPLNYRDSENNEYVKYLIDACQETSSLNKDQFSLIAFHMLYMSYIFKVIWQSHKTNHGNIHNHLQNHLNQLGNYENPFDLSIVKEEEAIKILRCFGFHMNRINQFQIPIKNRDHCAHASGFIQYKKPDVEQVVKDELSHVKAIQEKTKELLAQLFMNYFTTYYKPYDVNSFFPSGLDSVDKFIQQHLLSIKDLEAICEIEFGFMRMESSTAEIIWRKVFYLLTVAKRDELIGNDYKYFIDKFSLILNGIFYQTEISVDDLLENEFSVIWQTLTTEQKTIMLGVNNVRQ